LSFVLSLLGPNWKNEFKLQTEPNGVMDLFGLNIMEWYFNNVDVKSIGRLPRIAAIYLGKNMSEAFNERINGVASDIVSHYRSNLSDTNRVQLTVLKVNRAFMEHFRDLKNKNSELKKFCEGFQLHNVLLNHEKSVLSNGVEEDLE